MTSDENAEALGYLSISKSHNNVEWVKELVPLKQKNRCPWSC